MRITLAGVAAGHGGIQTHLEWLGTALVDLGHEISVISFESTQEKTALTNKKLVELAEGRVLALKGAGLYEKMVKQPLLIVRHLARFDPDIYIACGTGFNLFVPPLLRKGRTHLVFFEVMSGKSGGPSDSRWIAARAFDAVVAQANSVAKNFAKSFRYGRGVEVLPAFPEPLERFGEIPPQSGRRRDAIRMAMFGRLAPHKRAFWLVQKWPDVRQFISELHIFGSGPEEQCIREYIEACKFENEFFLHGSYPSGKEYIDRLISFDLTVLPTVGEEGAPLVLLESMACGVPFVACDVGGISDYANPDCLISKIDENSFIGAVVLMSKEIRNGHVDPVRLRSFYLENYSYLALVARWGGWVQAVRQRRARGDVSGGVK